MIVFKRFLKKTYFYFIALFLIILLVFISLYRKNNNVSVTTYLLPYSVVSDISSVDYLNVNLLLSEKNSFFSDKSMLDCARLVGDGNNINLLLEDIYVNKDKDCLVKNKYFYRAIYRFKIDFHVKSECEFEISDAILNMVFKNGIKSNILIGSFSYYKYNNFVNYINVNNIKPITNDNLDRMFYGFQFSIRNISDVDMTLFDVSLLDVNLKKFDKCMTDRIIESFDINDVRDKSDVIEDFNILIKPKEVKYFSVIFDLNDYDLTLMIESLGLRFSYLVKGESFNQTLEKFTFYSNYNLMGEEFNIYEYAY